MTCPLHRFDHEAMNTMFEAIFAAPDERKEYCRQAASALFLEIDRLEKILSRFDPGTDIAQLNRLEPGQWLTVAIEVVECLELAGQAYLATGGAFDAAFSSRGGAADRSAMEWLILTRSEIANDSQPHESKPSGHELFEADTDFEPEHPINFLAGIDPKASEHGFHGACIDLGAIGKGYALDKCVPILNDWGLGNYLLNAGTSTVLARGDGPEGAGWVVGVAGNFKKEAGIAETALHDEALSGSGTEVQGEHIRIPGTGNPASAHSSTWVRTQTAAWSDALSTAFMVMNNDAITALCDSRPEIAALTVRLTPEAPEIRQWGQWNPGGKA